MWGFIHRWSPGGHATFLALSLDCDKRRFITEPQNGYLFSFFFRTSPTEVGLSLFPRLRESPLGAGGESRNLGKRP